MKVDTIINEIQAGQTDAFQEIVREYQRDVWQVVVAVWRALGPQPQSLAVVEDLAQQVFVDAFIHLEQFQRGSDFRAWIKTIARNRVRQEVRSRSREQQRVLVYAQHLEQRLLDDGRASSHEEEFREALEQCTEELTDRAARIIRQRYEESLTFEQIAVQEASTANAVRKLFARALLNLKECIQTRLAQA